MTARGGWKVNVSVEEMPQGQWLARVMVPTPAGPRYFSELGPNRTAALLSLRQSLRPYEGDGYRAARAAVLERAVA
jgi:hypothetical protein